MKYSFHIYAGRSESNFSIAVEVRDRELGELVYFHTTYRARRSIMNAEIGFRLKRSEMCEVLHAAALFVAIQPLPQDSRDQLAGDNAVMYWASKMKQQPKEDLQHTVLFRP